jgi:hypothetical protein
MHPWKITKLDGRHTGNEWFTHSINYNVVVRGQYRTQQDNHSLFIDHRIWCWDNFGPSCELRMFDSVLHRTDDHQMVQTWAWFTEFNKLKLYMTEEALVFFTLAHSS